MKITYFTNIFGTLFLAYAIKIASGAEVSICGDWDSYKEVKCFKIIDPENLKKFDDAKKACENQPGGSIITISTEDEQAFLTNFLFKEKHVVDGVWLDIKKTNGIFKWVDGRNLSTTFWAVGSPTNTPDHECVQMSNENFQLGKWTDEPCTKKNLVVCQKNPDLSYPYLINKIIDIKAIEIYNKEQLNGIKIKLKGYFEDIYSDERSYFRAYNDSDGKHKLLLIPLKENEKASTHDEAVALCNKYKSTIVEVDSWRKLMILNSFLSQLESDLSKMPYFWLNGVRLVSGQPNFKWVTSGKTFPVTNWLTGQPVNTANYNYVRNIVSLDSNFGKWSAVPATDKNFVVCELVLTD